MELIAIAHIFIFFVINCVKGYNILIVSYFPVYSHTFLSSALARGLCQAGHNVTIISPFKDKYTVKNGLYREIILTGLAEDLQGSKTNFLDWEKYSAYYTGITTRHIGNKFTNKTLTHPNVVKLLNSNEKFDVVIIKNFVNNAMNAIASHFQAPLILFSTIGANSWINNLVGNPSPYSYIPDIYLTFSSDPTLWERLTNAIYKTFIDLYDYYYFFPSQNKIMKEIFPNIPDLDVVNHNVSLVLVNSHESVGQPVPLVPNMVQIGGFYLNPPQKLSEDLSDFLNRASDGVIYFSLGSNIKPSYLSSDTRKIIIDTFSKLKQQILWKWDEEHLEGKPDNVKISKWFPQQDILAHPNVKLFITHCGLLSTTETVYHGKPILAIPVFADQELNARRAETNGYAITIHLSEITQDKFETAINKLLQDPKYSENAKWRSAMMHDRPVKPMDLAIYWVEFVARHGGAPHLQVAGAGLPWYKYFLIDVLAILITLIISLMILVYILVVNIFSAFKSQNKVKVN